MCSDCFGALLFLIRPQRLRAKSVQVWGLWEGTRSQICVFPSPPSPTAWPLMDPLHPVCRLESHKHSACPRAERTLDHIS